MRSMLTAFAALAALAIPAGLPTLALAQEETVLTDAPPPNDAGARYQPDESSVSPPPAPRFEQPPVQDAQDRRFEQPPVQDRRGGGRVDRGGDGDDRDDDGSDDRGGWNQGRDDNAGGNAGGWNDNRDRGGNDNAGGNDAGQEYATSRDGPQRVAPRGSFADSCSGSYVNQGRLYADCRDMRGNVRGTSIELARCSSSDIGNDNGLLVCHNVRGDYEGRRGANGGGWGNDGWDRDRYNDGRDWRNDRRGRRDYDGFRDRWNQNDWRRDWNRGRGNDWWRNDRGFRGYTGYRFGFYFAPNYGYYSVPNNYWGQRWYDGDYLPSIFWRYSLSDYRTYGLGYPPPGTQWVAVDTTIYLIDRYDGYIIEVIHDAWRW